MQNPYASPRNDQESAAAGAKNRWWLEGVLAGGLLLLLSPAMVQNFLLLVEKLAGIGVFDPLVGGDPVWQRRPFAVPCAIFVAVATWLAVFRSARRPRLGSWMLAGVGALALLTALAALVPAPGFAPSP